MEARSASGPPDPIKPRKADIQLFRTDPPFSPCQFRIFAPKSSPHCSIFPLCEIAQKLASDCANKEAEPPLTTAAPAPIYTAPDQMARWFRAASRAIHRSIT